VIGQEWYTPIVFVGAALLIVGGVSKLREPLGPMESLSQVFRPVGSRTIRAIGVGEVGLGLAELIHPTSSICVAVAAVYLAFALYVMYRLVARLPGGCGCLGSPDMPPNWLHVGVNVFLGGAAMLGLHQPPSSLLSVLLHSPVVGVILLLSVPALTFAVGRIVTLLPVVFFVRTRGVQVERFQNLGFNERRSSPLQENL
jgi:hypothetical protein